MSVLTLDVDRRDALFLVQGMRELRRWCATQGHPMPAQLDQLEQDALAVCVDVSVDANPAVVGACRSPAEAEATVAPMVISIPRAAGMLSISTRTIERRIKTGEIRSTIDGRCRRIPMSEIERLATVDEAA